MAVTYRESGVDIDAGDRLVERIKPLARATRTREVVDGIGGFAGLCSVPGDIEDPLLVSGTDGVGTKLKVAFATGKHDTIGQDLVAMCVNDVITTGARPLLFLDYFACGSLDVDIAEAVVRGIADGCQLAGCALLGGETAEHPGMLPDGEYDLAGFSVGVVSRKSVLGPHRVQAGDALVAVASSGLHSNGYSLARHVFEKEMKLGYGDHVDELGGSVGATLLTPTRIYAKATRALCSDLGAGLHALCHITGGGIVGNLPRVLPRGTRASLELPRDRPAVFDVIEKAGPVEVDEMRRTFNLGVGLVAIVSAEAADSAVQSLQDAGEKAWRFGELENTPADSPPTVSIR